MGNQRRQSNHAENGVKQNGLKSQIIDPDAGMSFSFRIDDDGPEEYSDIEPEDSRPSTSRSRDQSSKDIEGSKTVSSRRKVSDGQRNRRSSDSSACHGQSSFRPSKAARRNSCEFTPSSGNDRRNSLNDSDKNTERTGRTAPLSHLSSDHSNSKALSHAYSDHSNQRDLRRPRSNGSIVPRSQRSFDGIEAREHHGKERRRAGRRNSCDYEYSNSRHSVASASRRRNSCDYEYSNSKHSINTSINSFSEDYSIDYMSSDDGGSFGRSSHGRSKPQPTRKASRRSSCDNESFDLSGHGGSKPQPTRKASQRSSCDSEQNSSRPSNSGIPKSRRRSSCGNGSKNTKPSKRSSTKTSRRQSNEYKSSKAAKPSRRSSNNEEEYSSRPTKGSGGESTRRNSWNDSYVEESCRQSKRAKQRQPRRLKSNPNPGNRIESTSEINDNIDNEQIKISTGRASLSKSHSKKKNSSSSRQILDKNQEVPKSAPKSIRLNSQLMRKSGDFRPYFVPLKRKQEVLNPNGQQEPQISQTFTAEIESFKVNDGPAQLLHEGMKNITVASFLHEGIPVTKVSHSKLGKLRRRILTLSEDRTTLFLTHSKLTKGTRNMIPKQPAWTPSKGWNGTYIRSVDVANISHFQVGVVSSRWLELSIASHGKKVKKGGEKSTTESSVSSSRNFLPYMPDTARVASIVTIYHIDSRTGRTDSLDFFIENHDYRRAVVATLALMKYTYDEVSQLVGNEILLYRYVLKDMNLGTDSNGMTEMNETDFLALCRRLNFSSHNVGKEFREFCKHNSAKYDIGGGAKNKNKLPIHECLQLIHLMKGKENPSLAAWRACFGTATCVNALTVLTKFLHGPQKEQTVSDIQDARDLVNIMNATELGEVLSNRKGSLLTYWQFEEFLRSEWNDIYDPEKRVIDKQQLLDKPLSHYWINSSFRTSSMSDGAPSVQSYTRALLRGCKSLDLNCWDGVMLPSGECVPIIIPSDEKPGTISSVKNKLTFRSIVLVVRKYLRECPTSYPIILNIENNCSLPFQRNMVKTMKEVFGKQLFIPTSANRKKELPSPEALRGMVVLNARKPVKNLKCGSASYRSIPQPTDDAYAKMFNKFNTEKPDSFKLESNGPNSRSFSNLNAVDDQIGEELVYLSLFHDVRFSGYFLESMDLICSQMHGINDTLVPKIVKEYSDNPELWRKCNASHLTRIYPNSHKNPSKSKPNFNPVLAWGMGCQMAALNVQNCGTELAVNDGFFRQTGEIGYIEKPRWLLGKGERPKSTTIKIRLLSGSCIPRAFVGNKDGQADDSTIDNPRVTLELHDVIARAGHGERFKISKHKVECGNKNYFSPIFEDKGKKFVVETPDVAMLVFRVEQNTDKGTVLSTTAIPVSCLRRGYRSVQLYDSDNTRLGRFASATLLVFLM